MNKETGWKTRSPLQLYGQEYVPKTWAMANMNMIILDMEGQIEIGNTIQNPKFRWHSELRNFDHVVANPMWNQPEMLGFGPHPAYRYRVGLVDMSCPAASAAVG